MSNRNFDSSYLTRRQGERQLAKNIVTKTRQNSSTSYNNISTNYDASIINQIREGQSMTVTKGETCTTVEPGCPCGNSNIITYPPGPPTPIFNPGISYQLRDCPADQSEAVTYPPIFGPGTPPGGIFTITLPPIIPPGTGSNPVTINSTTGAITIPQGASIFPNPPPPPIDPTGLYIVTYTIGAYVYTVSFDVQGC